MSVNIWTASEETANRSNERGMAMTYNYPRTVAEMIPARKTELEAREEVPECRAHGPMTQRPIERQTYEQMFCGLWYDCADCAGSALVKSRDLAHQLGEDE